MRAFIIQKSTPVSKKTAIPVVLFLILAATLISGCSKESASRVYELAPLNEMNSYVQAAPVSVQQAYQFAHANPEILKHVPCYCGCGGMGHTSNYSCYIKEADGEKQFDGHALGCSICVDITHDVMRLMDDGQSLSSIQEFIDNKYAAFGPSNMPNLISERT